MKDELVFLTSAQDGSGMNLTLPGAEKKSAEIEHFSSVLVTDEDKFNAKLEDAKSLLSQQEKETIAQAEKYIKEHKKDLEVPVPPSIPVECVDEDTAKANSELLDKFLKDAMEPEGVLMRALVKIETGKALTGQESNPATPLVLQLMARLEKKANLLMKTYRGKPDKVIPVMQFAVRVADQYALLGQDHMASGSFLQGVGDWVALSVDQLLKDIVEQHDYRKMSAVVTIAKWAHSLASQSSAIQFEKLLDRLSAAMEFKLQGKFTFTTLDSIFETQSEIPLDNDMKALKGKWTGNNQGTFNYTYLKGSGVTGKADPFTVNATMTKLDACKGEVTLSVDRFNPDTEVITIESQSITNHAMKTFWEYSFVDKKSEGGYYKFVVPLHNMEVNAVDELLDGITHCGSKCSSKFELKLIHTPKYLK